MFKERPGKETSLLDVLDLHPMETLTRGKDGPMGVSLFRFANQTISKDFFFFLLICSPNSAEHLNPSLAVDMRVIPDKHGS